MPQESKTTNFISDEQGETIEIVCGCLSNKGIKFWPYIAFIVNCVHAGWDEKKIIEQVKIMEKS